MSNEGPARGAGSSAFGTGEAVASGDTEPQPSIPEARLAALIAVLEQSRRLGFLGPGPVQRSIEHALAHGEVAKVAGATTQRVVDLGAGGGVPGLVLGVMWPHHHYVLVDAMHKRTEFLSEACEALSLRQVDVINGRGEDVARAEPESAEIVVARGFGAPAVTAEIAARILAPGGHLVASAGPETVPVWLGGDLAMLGFGVPAVAETKGFLFVSVQKADPTPDRFPRRTGMPAKRPLW